MRDSDEETTVSQPHVPSRASQRGLDWFTFFIADLQTGFGPFLSVYLTTQKWTQVDIGLVLSIGSIAGLLCQVPGGWIVDAARSKRRAAMLAVIGIGVCALLIAVCPVFLADLRRQAPARGRELGAGAGHRRHHPGPRGPCGPRASGSAATPASPRSATGWPRE